MNAARGRTVLCAGAVREGRLVAFDRAARLRRPARARAAGVHAGAAGAPRAPAGRRWRRPPSSGTSPRRSPGPGGSPPTTPRTTRPWSRSTGRSASNPPGSCRCGRCAWVRTAGRDDPLVSRRTRARRPARPASPARPGRRLGHRDVAAELGGQRGDARVGDPARHDPAERRQVRVAVQREAVHGHAAGDADADRGDLASGGGPGRLVGGHPDAAAALDPVGGQPERRRRRR